MSHDERALDRLRDALVKLPDGREAHVMAGPMLDARGRHQVCRLKHVATGEESWEFADDLTPHERSPRK